MPAVLLTFLGCMEGCDYKTTKLDPDDPSVPTEYLSIDEEMEIRPIWKDPERRPPIGFAESIAIHYWTPPSLDLLSYESGVSTTECPTLLRIPLAGTIQSDDGQIRGSLSSSNIKPPDSWAFWIEDDGNARLELSISTDLGLEETDLISNQAPQAQRIQITIGQKGASPGTIALSSWTETDLSNTLSDLWTGIWL